MTLIIYAKNYILLSQCAGICNLNAEPMQFTHSRTFLDGYMFLTIFFHFSVEHHVDVIVA